MTEHDTQGTGEVPNDTAKHDHTEDENLENDVVRSEDTQTEKSTGVGIDRDSTDELEPDNTKDGTESESVPTYGKKKKKRKADMAAVDMRKRLTKIAVIVGVSILALAGILVTVIGVIGISVFAVKGNSMEPSFHNGDVVILGQESGVANDQIMFFSKPKSWDDYAGNGYTLMKRVAAVPGDTLAFDGEKFTVNGESIYELSPDDYECAAGKVGYEHKLSQKEIFVMGDNANHSLDSRRIFCDGKDEDMFVPYQSMIDHGYVKAVL